jgi:hypothetical protein
MNFKKEIMPINKKQTNTVKKLIKKVLSKNVKAKRRVKQMTKRV